MDKSHRLGAEEWRQIIDGQRRSGLSVAAYCLERGVTQGSFYTWKQRLRSPAKPERLFKPTFVEVKPPIAKTAGTIEIRLRGDRHLLARRGFDRELLIELIRTLEATPCDRPPDAHVAGSINIDAHLAGDGAGGHALWI